NTSAIQLRVVAAAPSTAPVADPAPPAGRLAQYAAFACPSSWVTIDEHPAAADYLLACDDHGTKYLLEPAAWQGSAKNASARAEHEPGTNAWVVDYQLGAEGTRVLARLSRKLMDSGQLLAMVVDGRVLSAASFNGVVTDGSVQVGGNLDKTKANALADELAGR